MAFLLKNHKASQNVGGFEPVLDQWIRVDKPAAALPATAAQDIFTVRGGRVLVKALIGEVTTVVQAQLNNLQVEAAPTTGTAVDIATDVDINADEVGTLYAVEGDGTALVAVSSGYAQAAQGNGFVLSPGKVRIRTSATSTGATKWSIYYLPLDPTSEIVSA